MRTLKRYKNSGAGIGAICYDYLRLTVAVSEGAGVMEYWDLFFPGDGKDDDDE